MNPRERKPQGSELDQALRFGKEVVTRARQFSGEFLLSSKERLTKPSEVEIIDKIVNSGIRNFVWFHCSITDTMQQAVVEKAHIATHVAGGDGLRQFARSRGAGYPVAEGHRWGHYLQFAPVRRSSGIPNPAFSCHCPGEPRTQNIAIQPDHDQCQRPSQRPACAAAF